jgi:glutathione synthase/RimK-type ligase-like ATP-grasp enzyme
VILVWGIPGDDPLDAVWAALGQLDADALLLDQRDARQATVRVDPITATTSGTITTASATIDLAAVGAAFIRPQESSPDTRCPDATLVAWADVTTAGIVNRPAAMAGNNSKPYQLALLQGFGFDVPDTLVTTDPDAVKEFRRYHGTVIYKSVSGVRSIVSRFGDEHHARLADVASGPTQFQEHIPGEDVRVHVVGDVVHATMVRSGADDYRYAPFDGATLEVTETELPTMVADLCRSAALRIGLFVAGFDLRRTPDGRWVCFEANPSPAFTFYEHATGQPIAAAIAQLLIRLDERRVVPGPQSGPDS